MSIDRDRLWRLATTTTDLETARRALLRIQDIQDAALLAELEEEAIRRAVPDVLDLLSEMPPLNGIWCQLIDCGSVDHAVAYVDADGDLYVSQCWRTKESGGYYAHELAAPRIARSLFAVEAAQHGRAETIARYLAEDGRCGCLYAAEIEPPPRDDEEDTWIYARMAYCVDRTCGARDCTRCHP